MKLSTKTKYVTQAALIAAFYTVLTLVSYLFGLDKGVIQLRLSEALAVLPAFTPAAIPGLFLGCALSSFLSQGHIFDVVFGSLVTLSAAALCYLLRGVSRYRLGALLLPLPNIVLNAALIPLVLIFVYGVPDAYPFLLLTVGVGELLASGVLGVLLYFVLLRRKNIFAL